MVKCSRWNWGTFTFGEVCEAFLLFETRSPDTVVSAEPRSAQICLKTLRSSVGLVSRLVIFLLWVWTSWEVEPGADWGGLRGAEDSQKVSTKHTLTVMFVTHCTEEHVSAALCVCVCALHIVHNRPHNLCSSLFTLTCVCGCSCRGGYSLYE